MSLSLVWGLGVPDEMSWKAFYLFVCFVSFGSNPKNLGISLDSADTQPRKQGLWSLLEATGQGEMG